MKHTTLFIYVFLLLFMGCGDQKEKKTQNTPEPSLVTNYYLIRHAEKDRSNPDDPNPALTEQGMNRARAWATYFDTIPLDRIYSTDYHRTQQTASFTASKKQLEVISYDPRDLNNEAFQEQTKGLNVLIVGHSNTTPAFANAILGTQRYEDMDDSDNSSIYRITIKNGQKHVEKVMGPL